MRRSVSAAALGVGMLAASAAPAVGVITPTRDASTVARAIADDPRLVVGAEFTQIPPAGFPAAVATTPLGQFPTSGNSYAILATGDARAASRPNTDGATGGDAVGAPFRGARDVTTLRVDVDVPPGQACLTFGFRFLSEEFPEWVGSEFNDAFIAELDSNTWDASGPARPRISAPANFAFDTLGNPVSINGLGEAAVIPSEAIGTTYDAATRRLRAAVPVTPGRHSVYFTIFDQGDRNYDSAVFLDRLQVSNLTPCVRGVAADLTAGRPAGAIEIAGRRVSIPVTQVFLPARLAVKPPRFTPSIVRNRRPVRMRVQVADDRGYLVRGARVTARSVPNGLLRQATAVSGRDGFATLRLRPTARLQLGRGGSVPVYVCASRPRESTTAGASDCRIVGLALGR